METEAVNKNSELHNAMLVSCPFLQTTLGSMKIGCFIVLQKSVLRLYPVIGNII